MCILAVVLAPPLYGATITFEGVPQTYWYGTGYGNQNLGSYYAGVTFGPNAYIYYPNPSMYPPHSPNAVLFSTVDSITVDLAQPTNLVSLWYTTSKSTFFVYAYAGSTLVDSAQGYLNAGTIVPPVAGSSSFIQVDSTTPNITRVVIQGIASKYVVDDLTVATVPIPAAFFLFAPGLLGLVGLKRKYRN